MYTWEIKQHLEQNNYYIESELYLKILESPQIVHVKYKPFENKYFLATSDGYNVEFTVYCKHFE